MPTDVERQLVDFCPSEGSWLSGTRHALGPVPPPPRGTPESASARRTSFAIGRSGHGPCSIPAGISAASLPIFGLLLTPNYEQDRRYQLWQGCVTHACRKDEYSETDLEDAPL